MNTFIISLAIFFSAYIIACQIEKERDEIKQINNLLRRNHNKLLTLLKVINKQLDSIENENRTMHKTLAEIKTIILKRNKKSL